MLKRAIARVPVLIGHGVGFKSSCWLSHLQIRSEISAYFKLRKKKRGKKGNAAAENKTRALAK